MSDHDRTREPSKRGNKFMPWPFQAALLALLAALGVALIADS